MKFVYYNANPLGRRVNDCTVRAISLATNRSWRETFIELSKFALDQAIMIDETTYIDEYLINNFTKLNYDTGRWKFTVKEFIDSHPFGTYLITMNGHITCVINGVIYDTFNPSDRIVWDVYEVK